MPNEMPGAGRYVRTNMNTPTVSVGGTPTWRGRAMGPHTVVPIIPGLTFEAKGTGVYSLSQPGRFPRGTRVSGRRGTFDLWITLGAIGSERTLAYLTDDSSNPYNFIAIKVDASNRPFLEIQQVETPLSTASGTLTATGAITNTETLTIDSKVYTVQSSLTDVDGNVLQGATVGETLDNLVAAITLGPGAGTLYASSTTVHPTATAARGSGDSLVATAKLLGTGGNSIATTETTVNASWGGATLSGGGGSTVVIAGVTPSYGALAEGAPAHIRMTWDSDNPVSGARYASLSVNEAPIPPGDWSTDPTDTWEAFQPQYLVVNGDLLGASVFNGVVGSVQLSEVVSV
jgi:hypothetical protein